MNNPIPSTIWFGTTSEWESLKPKWVNCIITFCSDVIVFSLFSSLDNISPLIQELFLTSKGGFRESQVFDLIPPLRHASCLVMARGLKTRQWPMKRQLRGLSSGGLSLIHRVTHLSPTNHTTAECGVLSSPHDNNSLIKAFSSTGATS